MKLNSWLILTMFSASLFAQQVTNPPPAPAIETPAAAPMATNAPATTNAPAAKAAKKKGSKKKGDSKSAKKKAPMAELKTVPLVPGVAEVVASNVNVRGQAKLKSEVLTHVQKGQKLTVLEEIVNNNSAADEPSAWAKIVLPPGAHAWINSSFVEGTNKSVKPKKLNVRSGPGENYSVIGTLLKGAEVKEMATKGDWMEIEPPTNSYAFVAAQFLKQEAAPTPNEIAANEPPTAPATSVNEPPPVVTAPTEMPPTTPTLTPAEPAPAIAPTNATAPATSSAPAVSEEPPPPRVVQHEGIVRSMTSIQAPSHFELVSPDNGKRIDYLYSTAVGLDLRRYKGLRVIVTGEEGLDERWPNTPVLTIQKIQPVE
jgi:uncharacterized protein YgiM (DUF1202 family)